MHTGTDEPRHSEQWSPPRWTQTIDTVVADPCALHARPTALVIGRLRLCPEGTMLGVMTPEDECIQDLGEACALSPARLIRLRLRQGQTVRWFAGGPAEGAYKALVAIAGVLRRSHAEEPFTAGHDRVVAALSRELGDAREARELCDRAAMAALSGAYRGDVTYETEEAR